MLRLNVLFRLYPQILKQLSGIVTKVIIVTTRDAIAAKYQYLVTTWNTAANTLSCLVFA